jgi:RNA polymerase sigma-70 factor, ECF subfamily
VARSTSKLAVDVAGLPDMELVALARDGRGSAFREIIQRHNQRLFRLARSVVRSDDEAEDIVQDAYCRAFAALDTFRGDASLATWLSRIALNEALTRQRQRQRRPTVALAAIEEMQNKPGAEVIAFPLMTKQPDPEREVAQREVRRLLEKAIDDLPEGFRTVFTMRVVEGMSIEETASLLDLRPETVKTRLHRARRMLQEGLDSRLHATLGEAFPFASARCARFTAALLKRLGHPDA